MVLARRFVQRWDLYAVQLDDGRYVCVRKQLNVGHLFAHLRGELTLGAYVLDRESRARFIVFDGDDDEAYSHLLEMTRALASEDVPAYVETSRRGGHLWLFFVEAIPGHRARAFGRGLLANHDISGVEIFPKQDHLGEGPGSLIRMPFGFHRLTRRRYGFVTPDGGHLAPTIREQIHVLSAAQTVPEGAFDAYRQLESSHPPPPATKPKEPPAVMVSEKVKASVTVLEFVSQYVDLKLVSVGALGLCPFHDDHRPSFGVNDEGNYWHCFAGCGGGSVIDFWMKWRECDFATAIAELAGMLL